MGYSMTEVKNPLYGDLVDLGAEMLPTGSKVICPECAEGSDNDIVVHGDVNEIWRLLHAAGYKKEDDPEYLEDMTSYSSSWRKDDVNYIVTGSNSYYYTWIDATERATKQHLCNRADRIKLFKEVRKEYGF
jgi:hypothetical protein